MHSRNSIGIAGLVNKALPVIMISTLVGLGVATAVLSGCNTVKGAGADLERGGEKLQNSADRHGAQ